jgi:hypothetical protein
MRTLPAAAVALPGRRRFGASAVGAGPAAAFGAGFASAAAPATLLSVQDTPLAARRIGVSWTLERQHPAPAPDAALSAAPPSSGAPPFSAAPRLSVQDTPLAPRRIGVSWTLNPPPHHRGSVR